MGKTYYGENSVGCWIDGAVPRSEKEIAIKLIGMLRAGDLPIDPNTGKEYDPEELDEDSLGDAINDLTDALADVTEDGYR